MQKISLLLSDSKTAVSYMISEITHICRNMKKRAPGSTGEREAGSYMADILKKDCGCMDVTAEKFKARPSSFYGYFYVSAVLECLCAASFFIKPWLSIVFGLFVYLVFLMQFVLYKPLIDPLFPERESINVTAVRPCSGECRQRIFLNGHIDAAWEFPISFRFGGIAMMFPPVLSILGVMFYIVISVFSICGAGSSIQTAGLCGLAFVPFFIALAFTYDPKCVVDGANDDLSGCFMGIAVLREMERLGITLEHTEVGVILTGSEEAGLRGAKAWCKAHKDDYNDVPTYIFSYDTVHDPEQLMVNIKDLNSTVRSDSGLCKLFSDAASAAGVPCKKGKVPLLGGSTDSAAFTQGGFRSAGITGLSHKWEDYYHTRRDTCDNLNEAGLENCYRATVTMISDIERCNGTDV